MKNIKSITSSTIIHARESFPAVNANQYGDTKNKNISKIVVKVSQITLKLSSGKMIMYLYFLSCQSFLVLERLISFLCSS